MITNPFYDPKYINGWLSSVRYFYVCSPYHLKPTRNRERYELPPSTCMRLITPTWQEKVKDKSVMFSETERKKERESVCEGEMICGISGHTF